MKRLEEAGGLKEPYRPHSQPEVPMQLWRLAAPLLCREKEVQQVLRSLLEHSAAVIWGGPGEGKSSIAMEAGCRLWESGKCLGGCFQVDLNGELAASCDTKTPYKVISLASIRLTNLWVCRAGIGKDGIVKEFIAGSLVPRLATCKVRCVYQPLSVQVVTVIEALVGLKIIMPNHHCELISLPYMWLHTCDATEWQSLF